MRICVFCSASDPSEPALAGLADAAGAAIAARGHELVYGGTDVGLMGRVAAAVRAGGGRITGILPERMREGGLADDHVDEQVVTTGMAGRKEAMIARSDGFLVLPGGFGTLDELLEVMTLRMLGYHELPIVLVDHAEGEQGFWHPLLAAFERLYAHGLASDVYRALHPAAVGVDAALDLLEQPGAALGPVPTRHA